MQDLAQQTGMQVPQDDQSPQERERAAAQRQKQATLTDVLEKAGEAWRQHLRESPRAIQYFKGRGVSGQVAKRYGLGYAPEGWRSLASVFPQYDDPLLEESGLVIVNEEDGKRYDRFRDRVMFPIRNVKGECIGFGGRVLGDDKPKYLNSPETPVFHKGRELYGLFEARSAIREAGYALVTEGYMDVVALAQLGFPNAVATLGTACTPEHVHKLFRFTDQVVFSFDGDAAGRRAARKALDGALPYASDTRSIKFLFLPPEHDPDSFIRAHGPEAFARHVGDAMPLSRFLLEAAREGCDLGTAEGRAHMLSNARPLWSRAARRRPQAPAAGRAGRAGPAADARTTWPSSGRRTAARAARASPAHDGAPFGDEPPWAPQPPARWQRRYRRPWRKGGDARAALAPRRPQRPGPAAAAAAQLTPPARTTMPRGCCCRTWSSWKSCRTKTTPRCAPSPRRTARCSPGWKASCTSTAPSPGPCCARRCAATTARPLAERVMTGSHAQTEGDEAELRAELRGLLNRMLIEAIKRQQNALIAAAAARPRSARALPAALEQRRLARDGWPAFSNGTRAS